MKLTSLCLADNLNVLDEGLGILEEVSEILWIPNASSSAFCRGLCLHGAGWNQEGRWVTKSFDAELFRNRFTRVVGLH